MDKKVILAVAGSGKTYHIVEKLDESKRFLIITYTTSNTENLRNAIINKFGYLPKNIKIKSYFTFLYSFCFKPFLSNELNVKGIYWKLPTDFFDKSFITKNRWLYHNRIAKLLIDKNIVPSVIGRLEKYYDCLYVDEVQDFGGHDFNFLSEISKCNMDILFVGDFFQHTFTTSIDGKVNINLYKDQDVYLQRFRDLKFNIDTTTLVNSRRCSKTICDFIRERIGINFFSNENRETEFKLVTDEIEADKIFNDHSIIKLFLKEHYNYNCRSDNWGSCKGLEFEDVCVVINDDTLKLYISNMLANLAPTTKNKFYVACSRSKNNLYLVPQNMYKKYH